jgi:hypothetical protein
MGEQRTDFPGEGTDLIANRRGGLTEELLGCLEGGGQGLCLGDQGRQRGVGDVGEALGAGQRRVARPQRRRELAQRFLDRLLLVGEVAESGVGGSDEAPDVRVAAAELGRQLAEVVDHVGQGHVALRHRLVQLRHVMDERLEATEGIGELLAPAPHSLGASGHEELDVLPRVGVERGEEGVEVGVGFGLRQGEVSAVPDLLPATARVDLHDHVVQPGFRPQLEAGVGVDQLHVLGLDVHADHGVPAFEVDRGDFADFDPGDVNRLTLPRRDGLGGRELGRDVVEFFPDQRQPGGQRRFLLGEDGEHHHDARETEDQDRDRVLAAAARLAREPGAEVPPAIDFGRRLAHGFAPAGDGEGTPT